MSANVVVSDLSSLQLILPFQHAFSSILSVQKVPIHLQFHRLPDLHDCPCLPGAKVYWEVRLGETVQYSSSQFLFLSRTPLCLLFAGGVHIQVVCKASQVLRYLGQKSRP